MISSPSATIIIPPTDLSATVKKYFYAIDGLSVGEFLTDPVVQELTIVIFA